MAELDKRKPVSLEELMVSTLAHPTKRRHTWVPK
jgi:hypothetical protein